MSDSKCKLRHSPDQLVAAVSAKSPYLSKFINRTIEDLCKCRYFEATVFKIVLTNGGNRVKAEEIVEEGLVRLSTLIRQGKFKGGQLEAYAITICRNLWLNMRRKKDEQWVMTGEQHTLDSADLHTPETNIMKTEKRDVLKQLLLESVDGDCLKIMKLKFIEGLRHAKIAEEMGLANADGSKDKLSRCKRKALKGLKNHPNFKEMIASVGIHLRNS